MVWSDTNETNREKKRKSEGLKMRDGECDCQAIFGLFFPTHTLTLLRLVVVENGGC